MNPNEITIKNDQSSIVGIPGLGTDDRIFSRLSLQYPITYLNWIEPKSTESLADYAARIIQPIQHINSPILLGVSFGGMLALEISRLIKLKGIIIISGIKDPAEKPFSFRLMHRIPYYRLTKGDWRIKTIPYWSPVFGIRKKSEQELLKQMFSTFSDNYRMWAIREAAQWKGSEVSCPVSHLHGKKDKVFPASLINNAHFIDEGTHFMIYQQAHKVSSFLNSKIGEWK